MKKIWQTHILQDTKLKRKKLKKKSALTVLFKTIAKWNSTLNLIVCNEVKLKMPTSLILGARKIKLQENAFLPTESVPNSFSTNLTSDF